MIEIKFSGNSTENLHRQIAAYLERIEIKEVPRRGKHERKNKAADPGESDLGEG